MKKQIIFNIAGGLGKNIMATVVVASLKKSYPDRDIIVTTPWGIAWEGNPNVAKIVDLEKNPFFYRDHIKGTDSMICRLDPYNADDFFHKRKHLIEIWCDLCGVPYDVSIAPKLFFTDAEKEAVKKKLFHDPSDKRPLFFIQPSGGASTQPYPISWARDLPLKIAQEVVDAMNKKGYRTIHFRRDKQLPLEGAEWIPFTLREALCAIQFSDKRLFVDSVAAHAAAAFELPSVVTWVTNTPKIFGYKMHTNLETVEHKDFRHMSEAYLEPYNIAGVWSEHPYHSDAIFDSSEILNKLL